MGNVVVVTRHETCALKRNLAHSIQLRKLKLNCFQCMYNK